MGCQNKQNFVVFASEPVGGRSRVTELPCYYGRAQIYRMMYSINHVYLHRPNAFGFWQLRLHLCYETLKRVSNFSELS